MAFTSPTTRIPQGVTNASAEETYGQAGVPDPTWAYQYVNDFSNYVTTDFVTTLVGTGTVALQDSENGSILLTTTAGGADAVLMQGRAATVKLTSGKDTFFKFAGTLSEVANCAFHCGLIATSTTPLAAADGLYLYKAPGAATLALVSIVGGVSTSTSLPTAEALVAGAAFELGIHVDVQGNVEAFFSPGTGTAVQRPANGDSRGRVAALYLPTLTSALLNLSFGLTNSSGVARTLAVDYLALARHR
jgi:hypothetical protein